MVTASEAADLWGLSRDALQAMANRGDFGEGARKSGGTWLFVRAALVDRYGLPRSGCKADAGVPVMDLLANYGLKRLSDVLARRDEFPARLLWRSGRRWMTTREGMDKVFGREGGK